MSWTTLMRGGLAVHAEAGAMAERGERAAIPLAAHMAEALIEDFPASPEDAALRAFDIGGYALLAERPDLAARCPVLPDGSDWHLRVLVAAARSWLALASGQAADTTAADEAYAVLLSDQALEEARYLAAAERPRAAAYLCLSTYLLVHAVRRLAAGDTEGCAEAAGKAMTAADAARHTPQAVATMMVRTVSRTAPGLTAIKPAPGP